MDSGRKVDRGQGVLLRWSGRRHFDDFGLQGRKSTDGDAAEAALAMLRMRRMVGGRRSDSDWSTVLVALNSMAAPVVVRMRMTLRSIRFML